MDIMSTRKWVKRGLNFEWFRANQIRMARKGFQKRRRRERGVADAAAHVALQGEIFDKK